MDGPSYTLVVSAVAVSAFHAVVVDVDYCCPVSEAVVAICPKDMALQKEKRKYQHMKLDHKAKQNHNHTFSLAHTHTHT